MKSPLPKEELENFKSSLPQLVNNSEATTFVCTPYMNVRSVAWQLQHAAKEEGYVLVGTHTSYERHRDMSLQDRQEYRFVVRKLL